MRYVLNEKSILVGQFATGSEVTIKLLVLDNDLLLDLNTDECIESEHIPGLYMWNTSNILATNNIDGYTNILYEMTSTTGEKYYGKFVYGGYVDKDITVDMSTNDLVHSKIMELLYLINAQL